MKFTELSFSLEVLDKSYFVDWFWANHLRGFLGMKIKKIFCIQRNTPCHKCLVQNTCSYFQTYELQEKSWRISPPPKSEIPRGGLLEFKIVLWSGAMNYALHFIKAMECFKTDRLRLVSVDSFDRTVYRDGEIISDIGHRSIGDVCIPQKDFVLHLRTPLRIKRGKKLITKINQENMGFVFGFEKAKSASVDKIFERWIDFKRFSHRQRSTMRIGGVIGKYRITNCDVPLATHLAHSQVLGLGKGRTFGLGDILICH